MYKINEIIKNHNGEYAKIIYQDGSVYGISEWTRRSIAENATVAANRLTERKLQLLSPAEREEYSRTDLRAMNTDELYPIAEAHDVDTDQNKPDVLEDLFDKLDI